MHKLIALVCMSLSATAAHASILLDTGSAGSNGATSRTSVSGPGQGVAFSVNTTVTQFGFYLDTPNSGNLEFMVWDGTNTNLLFSQIDAAAGTSTPALVSTNPISLDLTAGNTYYFGVVPDATANIDFFSPPIALSENGLTLVNPNTNYGPFGSPIFMGTAAASIGLQIQGTQSATPEPGTWFSALTGMGLLALSWRRGTRGFGRVGPS